MLDKRLLCTGVALALVIMMTVVVLLLPRAEESVVPLNEALSDVEKEPPASQPTAEFAYILKEHNGRIGVFAAGSDKPELILDVMVRHLPEYDQEQLKTGVPAKTYSELVNLIEDYNS